MIEIHVLVLGWLHCCN